MYFADLCNRKIPSEECDNFQAKAIRDERFLKSINEQSYTNPICSTFGTSLIFSSFILRNISFN